MFNPEATKDKRLDFSFDQRIARQYNDQRAHPLAVAQQIGEAIAALLPPGAHLLELGIGTGRIAYPVASAGCRVVGVDLSRDMLHEVGRQSAKAVGAPLLLAQADIEHLPIKDRSMDAVLAVHVLHLVPDWRGALAEAARTLRAGGAFIQGRDWVDPNSVAGQIRHELRQYVMTLSPTLRPPATGKDLALALAELSGAPPSREAEIVAAEWEVAVSPAEMLASIAARNQAESWVLTDELLEAVVTHLQRWTAALWPDLQQKQPVTQRFLLSVTRGPW